MIWTPAQIYPGDSFTQNISKRNMPKLVTHLFFSEGAGEFCSLTWGRQPTCQLLDGGPVEK